MSDKWCSSAFQCAKKEVSVRVEVNVAYCCLIWEIFQLFARCWCFFAIGEYSWNQCLLPRIDSTGFMRVKMDIALRQRTLSPVRLVLEDSLICRSGGSWRGVPKRLNNGVLSSMQKQTQKRLKSGFKCKYYASCPLQTILFYDFDLRATHARTLLPEALASVSLGFVLVRVWVRSFVFLCNWGV